MTTNKHQGVVVPMATPFTAAGGLDEPAAERIVARLVENGLGVFVLGTTGESASVPSGLRHRLTEIAVAGAAGRVPVYAGIGDNCVGHAVDAAHGYLRLGVDAVVAHLPSYYLLEPAEMQTCLERLAHDIRGPLVIYNIPQTTRMSLPIHVVARLSELPTVVGFKDSENVPGRLEQLAEKLGGRADFSIFMGSATLSVKALRRGYHGLVPSSGNLAPHLWRDLYAAARAGDWDRAGELQHRLDAVAQVFQRQRSLAQSLAALKASMAQLGLCSPWVLPPLKSLDETASAALRAEMAGLGLL